jgi:hypothetical protein
VRPTVGHLISYSRPLNPLLVHRISGDFADVDNEAVPVGPIDGDGKTDSLLVLVKSDTADLDYLNTPICRKVEIVSLHFIGSSPLYCVLISVLLDA